MNKETKMIDSCSSSTSWYQLYAKLRFFSRIRRFLLHKTSAGKRHQPSEAEGIPAPEIVHGGGRVESETGGGDGDDDGVLQTSVKRLHFGSWEEKVAAVGEIKRLAGGDLKRRKLIGELGVIPPLVAMVGSDTAAVRRLAVQALVELATGNCTNKALMIQTGILSKLHENINIHESAAQYEFAQLIKSLSSLANAQFPIDSVKILPLTLHILRSDPSIETKMLCLGTLYNLSTTLDNVVALASNEVVNALVTLSLTKQASEKALATLGNLVVTSTGKIALENHPMVPESLIEVLTWDNDENPKTQESCAYVLMILAHESSIQRAKMAEAGIVPVLLEVALLGTPLAQKRAIKLLQWFKDERQTKMRPHSGPQTRRLLSVGSPIKEADVDRGKQVMKKMVRQSLYKNMETITRRANGDLDSSSKLKILVVSSSSKSLPY